MKPIQAKGLAYERKVGARLKALVESPGDVHSGQWIKFEDAGGVGYAQPDHYIVSDGGILLVECKLTQTRRAWAQLRELYSPLLEWIYSPLPVVCVQACRNLAFPGDIVTDFEALRDGATWHWLGH